MDNIEAFQARVFACEAALRECDSDLEQLRDTVSTFQKDLSDI
jgi:transposase